MIHNKTKNLFSFVSTLSGVQRFSLLKQVHRENVLEHTGMVAIFALTIAHQINDRDTQRPIDIGRCVSKAVLHDWDEAVTGDIVRPTKYFSKELRDEFLELEMDGIEKIGEKLEINQLFENWSVAKDKNTMEGYIVCFADLMAAVHRLWDEVLVNGNARMIPSAKGMLEFLKKLMSDCPTNGTLNTLVFGEVISEHYFEIREILESVARMPCEYREMME
jgi:5'-deoxynucleotidase YfbR-like HD superfamily hydrolase